MKKCRVLLGVFVLFFVVGLTGLFYYKDTNAAPKNGWNEENGKLFWYENGVKQGTEGRGKEIYDPDSDDWYWLDSILGGAKATSKEVYMESKADDAGNIGKWVRYDADGHMIKGWFIDGDKCYYYDPVYGTMLKGQHSIVDRTYFFNETTGVREWCTVSLDNHWEYQDGVMFWYENGIRQGYDEAHAGYRGKEIYDPGSNGWYWLDNVLKGAKATSKEVYMESDAGPWAERADGTGKWVRYDEDGHMIKGWYTSGEGNRYYYDPIYGTMAKGTVQIGGVEYTFNSVTGVLEGGGKREIPTGRLHVEGTNLVNAEGNPVQLKGVSTHGLAWYPEYVNYDAFRTLRDDWGANVVRLAMYTEEYGGYCSGGDRAALKNLLDDGVNYATDLGMYVIIDWHILNDNNPQMHIDESIDFFREISERYAGYENVLYEICNEPHWVSWNDDIKPYADTIVSVIRENDPNAIIIVGTNTWSQDVDDVIDNRVDDPNVMYTLHFYAATHKDWIRQKAVRAIEAGVPIFVTECSICDASGSGEIDYGSANEWLNFMNDNNISFVGWSLSNKAETSALISSWCDKHSDWSDDELSDAGRWFKQAIKG